MYRGGILRDSMGGRKVIFSAEVLTFRSEISCKDHFSAPIESLKIERVLAEIRRKREGPACSCHDKISNSITPADWKKISVG